MALPAAISTATCTFGKGGDALGADVTISHVSIVADRRLIWSATGYPVYELEGDATADEVTGLVTIEVPHVDQAGFIDRAGNAVTNWRWTLRARVTEGNRTIHIAKPFQPVVGQGSVDLDALADEDASADAVTATVPAVTSVVGETGPVTAEQLQAALGNGVTEDPADPGFYLIGA